MAILSKWGAFLGKLPPSEMLKLKSIRRAVLNFSVLFVLGSKMTEIHELCFLHVLLSFTLYSRFSVNNRDILG